VTWVAGVDGCKGGWIAVFRHAKTGRASPCFVSSLAEIIDAPEAPQWIAVDMPMGFLEAAEPGGRACERAARAILGPAGRASCVFSAPSRAALAAETYPEALTRNRDGAGVGLSKQAFNLFPKMREVDALLRARPGAGVFESHPEIAFARLAGAPLRAAKKTKAGQRARLALLEKAGFRKIHDWLGQFPRKAVAPDDMLDAAVVCLTALLRARNQAECLPAAPPKDRYGIEMAIWR
jgi:predicted RNase H-like nuclease